MTKRPDSWKILFIESEILNNRAGREFREDLVQSLHSTGVFQVALVVKNPPANAEDVRDMGSIPGLGRSPREGNGTPLQYSCLKNSTDRGAWQTTVRGVTKNGT